MLNRRRNRSTGEIDKLQPDMKDTVDQMLLAGSSYREIVEYLAANEISLSQMSVCRYARKYLATVEQMRVSQENMRMLMEEMDKFPDLDTAEVILRVASQNVFNAITNAPSESWDNIDPEKLLKDATALIRAAGHKKQVDNRVQSDADKALAANQALLFDVLSKKHPELYQKVMAAVKAEKETAQ